MSTNAMFVIAILCRALATIAAIAGATFLAYYNKEGWGWLLFVALCIGCHSLSHTNDDKEKEQEED